MWFIYCIIIEDKMRYIGITNNIKKREYQHNYDCYKQRRSKDLYNNVRPLNIKLELNVLKIFNNKVDAERYEAYLILKDFFTQKSLWQAAPKKIKYY